MRVGYFVSFFSKVVDQQPASLLKKSLWVHLQTFWGCLFLGQISKWLLPCVANGRTDNVVWKLVLRKVAYFCLCLLFVKICCAPILILIFCELATVPLMLKTIINILLLLVINFKTQNWLFIWIDNSLTNL